MATLDCGIDVGTTNVKVVLVGEDGQVKYARSVPSPRLSDGIGPVTDPMAIIGLLEGLIIDGWTRLGAGAPLRSIACAGVGEDGFGIDGNLRPTGPAIAWFDKRAAVEADELRQLGDFSERTGNAVSAVLTAAKWLWLHRYRRSELEDAAGWATLTDFPAIWWSGHPFMSCSLAPRTACYDIHERRWVDALLEAAHAPALPPVRGAAEVLGGVRHGPLRESGAASAATVVAVGGHDHPVAASAIRRLDPIARVDSLGTASLLYGETAAAAGRLVDPILSLSLPPSGVSGVACHGVHELTVAAAAVERDAGSTRAYLAAARLAGSPPRSQAELETPGDGQDIVVRRSLEATSLASRHMLEAMEQVGVPRGAIYTTGGWSRSLAFVELRASIFGEPINVVGDMELTAIGAALFAAEAATGQSVCPIDRTSIRTIEPVPQWAAEYQHLFAQLVKK